jgi:hypothetical protein
MPDCSLLTESDASAELIDPNSPFIIKFAMVETDGLEDAFLCATSTNRAIRRSIMQSEDSYSEIKTPAAEEGVALLEGAAAAGRAMDFILVMMYVAWDVVSNGIAWDEYVY